MVILSLSIFVIDIKTKKEERVNINKDQRVHFRLKTDDVKFPLEVKVEFGTIDVPHLYEMYVSSTVAIPSENRFDMKTSDRLFVISYDKKPENVYMTVLALTNIDIRITFNSKEGMFIRR